MASTYSSTNYSRNAPVAYHGEAAETQWLHATVTISAAPVINDVLNFGYLPPNAVVVAALLRASDMDTSTGILIDVGDAGSATRYFSAATVGQTGTASASMAVTGIMYKTTAKTLIKGLINTAPSGTGAAGTVELAIGYFVEE
jgi:hypothetical protein